MASIRIGVQFAPQHTDINALRSAWRRAKDLGVDSLWIWDHFFPIDGDPSGSHFECWTLLATLAADTSVPSIGPLVTCASYRNPDLIADMTRTIDALSGGRFVLGLGAGWSERDHVEYGYGNLPGVPQRLKVLEQSLKRIRSRLSLVKPPAPQLPILVGGGEKVMLRLVAHTRTYGTHSARPSSSRARTQSLTTCTRCRTMSSRLALPSSRRKNGTAHMPKKPLRSPSRRSRSSLLFRSCEQRAAHPAWLTATGSADSSMASIDVRAPQCDTSMIAPTWFSSRSKLRPNLVRP